LEQFRRERGGAWNSLDEGGEELGTVDQVREGRSFEQFRRGRGGAWNSLDEGHSLDEGGEELEIV